MKIHSIVSHVLAAVGLSSYAEAEGINKQTIYERQAGRGLPGGGAGGQILRRRTSVFTLAKDSYESDEIVSHQQSTGGRHGMRRTTGRVAGLLSPGTYADFFESALRRNFTAGVTTGALITVTAATPGGGVVTFTRTAGSYLTDGFKIGRVVRAAGYTTTGVANNARNFFITDLTALVMTGFFLDGSAGGAKAAGDSVTISEVGSVTYAPTTGHTNDWYTFEEWYPDVPKSELFTDCQVGTIGVGMPASGNCTCDLDFVGLDRQIFGAQQFVGPAAENDTEILTAVQGILRVNGSTVTNLTGLTLSVATGATLNGPVAGTNTAPGISRGRIRVTGQFTAQDDTDDLSVLYDDETVTSIHMVMTEDNTATSGFVAFSLYRVKLGGDTPDDGEKGIVRTYPFVAEYNGLGGAGTAYEKSIMAVQDSAAT